MNFKDIPKFTKDGNYHVDCPLDMLEHNLHRYINEYGLVMRPDFQRHHVWTPAQSTKYVEFLLRGGTLVGLFTSTTQGG